MSENTSNSITMKSGKACVELRDTVIVVYFSEGIASFEAANCQQICSHLEQVPEAVTSIIWNFDHCAQISNGARSTLLKWIKKTNVENIALTSPSIAIRALLLWTVYSAEKDLSSIQVLATEMAANAWIYPLSALASESSVCYEFIELIKDRRKFCVLATHNNGIINQALARRILRFVKDFDQNGCKPLIILSDHKVKLSKEARRLFDTFFQAEDRVVALVDKRKKWYKRSFNKTFLKSQVTRSFRGIDHAIAWVQNNSVVSTSPEHNVNLDQLKAKLAKNEIRSATITYIALSASAFLFGAKFLAVSGNISGALTAIAIGCLALLAWFCSNTLNIPEKASGGFCILSAAVLISNAVGYSSMHSILGPMIVLCILTPIICSRTTSLRILPLLFFGYTGGVLLEYMIGPTSALQKAMDLDQSATNIFSLGISATLAYFFRKRSENTIQNLDYLAGLSEDAVSMALEQINAYGSFEFHFRPKPKPENSYAVTLTSALTLLGQELATHSKNLDPVVKSDPRKSLLVFETDEDTRNQLEQWFKDQYVVLFAVTTQAAADAIKKQSFDFIMIDIDEVGSSSSRFYETLRSYQPRATLIGSVSNKTNQQDIESLTPPILSDLIAKPISAKKIIQRKLGEKDLTDLSSKAA